MLKDCIGPLLFFSRYGCPLDRDHRLTDAWLVRSAQAARGDGGEGSGQEKWNSATAVWDQNIWTGGDYA